MNPGRPSSGMAPEAIQTRSDLAQQLTDLRVRSGLTVRQLARQLDTPSATVGGYVSGRHLPGPAQHELFCALLRACGVDEDRLPAWLDAVARVRTSSDGRMGKAATPYHGLEPFQTEDAALFFGREEATAQILGRLRRLHRRPTRESLGMLLVVGPSGSGKSSLLRAGVAAAVQAGELDAGGAPWTVEVISPGETPLQTLDDSLQAVDDVPLLLVIDQFEELFGNSAEQRQAFLHRLAAANHGEMLVLAGLRADFYEAAVREPMLLPLLRDRQAILGPMTAEEVRRAIVEPARTAGVRVEDGLVDLLLADLTPGSSGGFAHEAGALPLLSHALLVTWERARRNELTIADYRAAGGLHGAVSQSAEELYGQLTPEQKEVARGIFCRLVRIEDGAPLTRRRIARHELEVFGSANRSAAHQAATNGAGAATGQISPVAWERATQNSASTNGATVTPADRRTGTGAEPGEVLSRFVAARLVTLDATTIELSHEALLTAWPRLADWVERDRADLRLHRQLTEAANQWIGAGRDQSLLLRGARLQLIADWAQRADHRQALNRSESDYLDASVALSEAERRAARRRTRTMQLLLGVVGVFALAAVILAVAALDARRSAERARDQALSRQVAIEASDLEATDPALAMQLAVTAYHISPTTQAISTLLDSSSGEMPTRILGPLGPTSLAVNGAGRVLAVAYANSHRVSLFDRSGTVPKLVASVLAGPAASDTYAVSLSPDGRLLAAGNTAGQLWLWRLEPDGGQPVELATFHHLGGTVYGAAFSPDGRTLAAALSNGTVREWSVSSSGQATLRPALVAPGHPSLQALAFSPSGRALAAVTGSGSLIAWSVARPTSHPVTFTTGAAPLTSVAYSPDGRTLVAGSQDALVYRWRVGGGGTPTGVEPPLHGFTSWVDSLAFSPDGRYLAAGDSDQSVRVWSTSNWHSVARLEQPAPVTGLAFTAADQNLVTVDEDGTTRIWQFPPPDTYRVAGAVYTIDYTASGDELAAVTGGPNGDVELWNVADPWRPVRRSSIVMPDSFGPVGGVGALSPDGRLLTVGNLQAKVRLVDLSSSGRPRLVGGLLGGATPNIEQLNFSPNMRLMSVGDDAGRIHLWNVSDPEHPTALPTLDTNGTSSNVFGVAYSPNGKLLAAACADHKVWLWSVADPLHPRLLETLAGFKSYVYTVAFTPSGRTLIAGSADDTIRLWNVSDPAHPRALGGPLTGPTSTVYQVAVSPDGRTLAASTTGQQVWLWNISNPARPRELGVLTAAPGELFDVAFSPNGQTMVAGGADQRMTFWDYHPDQVATRICSLAGSPITHSEWSEYVQGAPYHPPCR